MTTPTPARRARLWAVSGAAVLIAGIAALVIGAVVNGNQTQRAPMPSASASTRAETPAKPEPARTAAVVDESARDQGWVPEPITTDAEAYIRSAVSAAGTFDTQKSEYEDWIQYLGTWFTPDTRYASESDRQGELDAAKLEMRQGVVLPQSEWDSLAGERGRVSAVVVGEVSLRAVPQDDSEDMSIGTADVAITYTRSDGQGAEVYYDESTRLSVQVLCGAGSVPAPDSSQSVGDCKVVRFFTEPLEP